ncbi:hypothetical protein HMPREF1556_01165 [Porphyromonas sp. oral taxon 278 str. W7784]|nr:hypothetical protein HMPREF1556_01165 [Porphyromonas sp. oral taxon 278 str. W7784]
MLLPPAKVACSSCGSLPPSEPLPLAEGYKRHSPEEGLTSSPGLGGAPI